MYGSMVPQTYTISAASGTTVTLFTSGPWAFDASDLHPTLLSPVKRPPPVGRLLGVNARIPTGGGWTFASLQVIIFALPLTRQLPSSPIDDAFILYDSGTAAVVTPSDTTSVFNDDIGINEQWFGATWLGVAYTWTTSAGSGSSTLIVTPHVLLTER